MKKILIIALLLLFTATSALATGISWFGQKDSGRVGLGVSKDGVGFIVFEDDEGALTYIFTRSAPNVQQGDYSEVNSYTIVHKIHITHGPALFSAHSPTTEAGYFNLKDKGSPLLLHIHN